MNSLGIKVCAFFIIFWFSRPALGQIDPIEKIVSLLSQGNYEETVNLCRHELSQSPLDTEIKAEILYHMSVAYLQNDQNLLAQSAIEEAYNIIDTIDLKNAAHNALYINISNTLAYHYITDFEFAKGLKVVNKAIALLATDQNENPELLLQSYLRKIALLRMTSQLDSAFFYVNGSRDLLKSIHTDKRNHYTIQILSEEAASYADKHSLKKAIPLYEKIIEIAHQTNNDNQLVVFHNNLGIAYMRMGDYGSSKSHFLKSLSYNQNQSNNHSPSLVTCLSNLGLVNIYQEKYTEADTYYQQLLNITIKTHGPDHLRNGFTYRNLGLSQFYREDFIKAISFYKKSLSIFNKNLQRPHDEVADVMHLLGTAHLRNGDRRQGEYYLLEALNEWNNLNRTGHEGLTETLAELTQMHYQEGDNENAHQYLSKAYDYLGYCKNKPFEFDPIEIPIALVYLLKVDLRINLDKWLAAPNGAADKSLGQLFQVCDSLSQYLKYRFDDLSTRKKIYTHTKWMQEFRLEYLYHKKEDQSLLPDQIFTTFEKSSNVFLYEKRAENNLNEWLGMPLDIIDHKNQLLDSIAYHLRIIEQHKNNKNPHLYRNSLKQYSSLKDSLDYLLFDIKIQYPAYYHTLYHPNLITLKEVQQSLEEGSSAISYFMGDTFTYSIIVDHHNFKFRQLAPTAIIQDKVLKLNNLLLNKSRLEDIQSLCAELGSILLEDLDLKSVNDLTIIPNGILGLLPFEILQINNKNLLAQTNVNYAYAHTIQNRAPKPQKIKQALFMAPVFDNREDKLLAVEQNTRSGLKYLPETRLEVEELANLFGTQPYLYLDASKAAFKSMVADADIIHLATHGVIDIENPDLSHLYFYSDSGQDEAILYAGEIVNMNLQADLITLSACNTGVGKIQRGEGIGSIGRAFAYSGVTNQVISLWPVHDESTKTIMSLYYKNLKNGMSKGSALATAKQQYIKQSPKALQHPYYWAGFVYYGTDTPLQFEKNYTFLYTIIICIGILVTGYSIVKREYICSVFVSKTS